MYKARRTVLASLLILAALIAGALTPASVRAADTAWRGEYYANRWLDGAPAMVRDDAAIDFDWGAGSPGPNLPADNFSARWTRAVYFDGGRYRFTVRSDDGVRLFVDGQLVIDAWKDQQATTYTAERDMSAGDHALRLEYYENGGGALVRLTWERASAPPPPDAWRGEYFANPWLAGGPTLVRNDAEVNFNWGYGSPDPSLPPEGFSARWTRSMNFNGGRYRFTVVTDDGARLYIDGRLALDEWRDQSVRTFTVDRDMSQGTHTLRLEYYENAGEAVIRLGWTRIDGGQPTPVWIGEYYNNRGLSAGPVFMREDKSINFNWGLGSPDPRINADEFSVRWVRNMSFSGGTYRFTATSDDGVRLYIDGRLVIDQWQVQSPKAHTIEISLSSGVHNIRMEYFEAAGEAIAKLTWARVQAPRTVGNIVTCARPRNSWIKVYRLDNGRWVDTNPRGYSPISATGFMKLDGMWVDTARYGGAGHPYRVELWADSRLIRSVGNTSIGEPEFRVRAWSDNFTPWGCPAP